MKTAYRSFARFGNQTDVLNTTPSGNTRREIL
jgi:hypothetical protein